jgi:hypothetical protein
MKTKAKLAAGGQEDKLADAKRQGQAQFDSIKEMVEVLQAAMLTTREDQDAGCWPGFTPSGWIWSGQWLDLFLGRFPMRPLWRQGFRAPRSNPGTRRRTVFADIRPW